MSLDRGQKATLANPMLRRPPRHPQQLKDLLLIFTLDERPLRDPLPIPPPHNILPQAPLIQPHPLLTGQEPYAPVEDVVAGEIYQRRSKLVPRHEQEVDSSPDGGAWEGGGAVPFAAVGFITGRESDFEVALVEELRDHPVEDYGADGLGGGVWLCDDEVDVAGICGSASVGSTDGELDRVVDFAAGFPNVLIVAVHFCARDARFEVVVMGDADLLVFGQVGLFEEVGE